MSVVRSQALWYGAIYGALLAMIYYSTYEWLVGVDWARDDYNYCYLIPFVVLYLIWEKRNKWSNELSVASWRGLFLMVPGILLFWVGDLAGELFSLYISSWLIVVGILWAHNGGRKLKTMAFPLFVSLFLFPLPHFINTKLTFGLKLISTGIGIKIIHLVGMSAYQEGNVIDLGFTQLQVVDACSGLRYLIPLFIMSVLMAYFYRAALWKRIIIALSSIPLSIITNSLRIALTAILYQSFGPAAAEGFFHDFEGFVIFIVSMVVLLAEIWVLRKIKPRPDESFLKKSPLVQNAECRTQNSVCRTQNSVCRTQNAVRGTHIVAIALLAVTLTIHSTVDFREKIPSSKPFIKFPLAIGEWQGKRQFLDQQFIDTLQFSDYTSVDYSKPNSLPVNVYVAYYESQRKGRSIHSPETCLPGSGWLFNQSGTMTIPIYGKGPSSITVMRALMEKAGSRQLVYFWFDQRGRILTNPYEMKMYNIWDALIKKRTDGALIRVITPMAGSEKIEDADKRLQSFIKEIVPTLNEFIPA
jgi:exosortase D (VPLPA-CTERM-specific)